MQVLIPHPGMYVETHSEKILRALDEVITCDWRARFQEIADHIGALAKDLLLLREWTSAVASKPKLPELSGAQSFVVYQSNTMFARINIWFPKGNLGSKLDAYRRYLSIEELHNHDFNFFTTRLLGPGYVSAFYRGPSADRIFSPGEKLELHPLGKIELSNDKVLFVEKDLDYHSQEWVDELTVTLNIIPRSRLGGVQYLVDDKKRTVNFVIDNRARAQLDDLS